MRMPALPAVALVFAALPSAPLAQSPESLPEGWGRGGPAAAAPFSSMQLDREIKHGGVASFRIQLDVPADAQRIHIGAILPTSGTLWVDDLEFTVADTTVPTTGTVRTPREYPVPRRTLTRAPRNLDFETVPRP